MSEDQEKLHLLRLTLIFEKDTLMMRFYKDATAPADAPFVVPFNSKGKPNEEVLANTAGAISLVLNMLMKNDCELLKLAIEKSSKAYWDDQKAGLGNPTDAGFGQN